MDENDGNVNYVVFVDGVQTVLLFSDDEQIIEMALNVCNLEMFLLFFF